jgi:hypothetical protein
MPTPAEAGGDALATVLAFVTAARRRIVRRRLGAAALLVAAGVVCTLASPFLAPASTDGPGTAGSIAMALGGTVCAAGTLCAAMAWRGRPSVHTVACWAERELPDLRDSLATAVEGGSLAPVCAEYAARRLPRGAAVELEPARSRWRRRALVAGALSLAALSFLAVVLTRRGSGQPSSRPATCPESGRGSSRPAPGRNSRERARPFKTAGEGQGPGPCRTEPSTVEATPVRDGGARQARTTVVPADAALQVRTAAVPADAALQVRTAAVPADAALQVRTAAVPANAARGASPSSRLGVRAAEVLVPAPAGYERAMELYLSGGRGAEGPSMPPPRGR